jgi:hypothetical protein
MAFLGRLTFSLRAQILTATVVIFGGALPRLDFLDLYGYLHPPVPSIL